MNRLLFTLILTLAITATAAAQQSNKKKNDTLVLTENCHLIIPQVCDPYDVWIIYSDCNTEGFRLTVYNRWGEEVYTAPAFEKNGYALGHGHRLNKKGKEEEYSLPEGTYYWAIEVKLPGDLEFRKAVTGYVTLIQIMD